MVLAHECGIEILKNYIEGASAKMYRNLIVAIKMDHAMKQFPGFMKQECNRIDAAQQNTDGIEGYFFEGSDGSQMAFWECHVDRESSLHVHPFDEYIVCVSGEYVAVVAGREVVLHAGDELFVPKGTEQGGRVKAGTRTIHAFGGKRIHSQDRNSAAVRKDMKQKA